MQEENLSYVYKAWLDWSHATTTDFMALVEVFDEHIIVADISGRYFLVPYVGSSYSGNAVFSEGEPVTIEYFRFDSSLLWDRLKDGEVEISRSASGRALCIFKESGETISMVAEGYLEDIDMSSDFLHYTLEEG